MADNPYVNKVDLADGSTLIDLTGDTATEADVVRGKTFHLASGAAGVGSVDIAGSITDSEVDSVLADSAPTGTASLRLSQLSRFWNGLKAKFAALNAYPVGSIYMSVNSTSPATLFGGTWERIQDMFLLAAGSSYSAGSTGGAETVTLTSAQSGIPAHTHGLNSHTHTVGAHSHGLNSHTHTYSKSNTSTAGTSLSVANMPSHNHNSKTLSGTVQVRNGGGTCDALIQTSGSSKTNGILSWTTLNNWSGTHSVWAQTAVSPGKYDTLTVNATHTHDSQGSGTAHSHTISLTSTNSGQASGSTENSTAFDSGASSGNTSNNAASDASSAHENMPPYLAVYVWKRTA